MLGEVSVVQYLIGSGFTGTSFSYNVRHGY